MSATVSTISIPALSKSKYMMSSKCHFFLLMTYCLNGIYGQILSRNRPVYMSSQWSDWSGDRVVDGDYRTDADDCGCCAATSQQKDPWITIDLGNAYLITRIRVYGRTDHDGQDLNGLVFKLDDTTFTPITDSTPTPIQSYTLILDRPTAARNVNLMLPGSNRILVLCEFDVFNDNIISINKSITASSQVSANWPIQGAVDGNNRTDGNACRCCAATNTEDNPWMYVDLGGYFYITYIIIYGRTDDKPDNQRFHGLEIEAANGNIINVPDTDNYYDSGAMRVGPVIYVKLQLNGIGRLLIVCELQVFGECADGYTDTDTSCQTVCPAGTYGANCANICGQCRNGANCNPIGGVCQQCEDGFSEADNTCKTRAENVSNPSSSCSNPPDSPDVMMIVGVTVATMLAIEGAAVVIIRLIRKRKSLRNDNVGEPNPYELPDRSINEDEHQYDSAMDMNDVTPNYANTDLRAT